MRILFLGMVLALAACGDKVPQSEAAKKVGDIPKQTIDNTKTDLNKALQQGSDRLEKKE